MNETNQRWTFKRKSEIVLQIIKGQTTIIDVCRKNDLKQSEIQVWIDDFIAGGRNNLKTNAKEEQSQQERQIKDMQATIGELYLELDARKKLQALYDQEETNS
jgi:transposase-like protein